MKLNIRVERAADIGAVRIVNERAFARRDEADLVDRVRANCPQIISLVAETEDGTLAGHALFSPVTIDAVIGAGLGPVAVLPEFQRKGIGSSLIRAGIEQLRAQSSPFVVVLGHPEYYPRFGFEPAGSRHGIRSTWAVPDEVFMILILDATAMTGVTGTAKYRSEFDAV